MIGPGRTVPEPIYRAALIVVEAMTYRTQGMGRLDRLPTLMQLAESMGCVVEVKVGCESSYSPDPDVGGAAGAIAIDKLSPRLSQIINLAHEIGHHMIYWRERFLFFPRSLLAELEECGDKEYVNEEICQTVEVLVIDVPSGFMWNGKLAPPRGDGTIRCFARLNRRIPSQQMPFSEIDRLLAEPD